MKVYCYKLTESAPWGKTQEIFFSMHSVESGKLRDDAEYVGFIEVNTQSTDES